MKWRVILAMMLVCMFCEGYALDHKDVTKEAANAEGFFTLIDDGKPASIVMSADDLKGVGIAVENLSADFEKVCGVKAPEIGRAHV